jgi:phosphoribosyl-AMP cyclohydrolase
MLDTLPGFAPRTSIEQVEEGATSGLTQIVVQMRIDDDQDAVWLRVKVAGSGASCHVGYRSCFYRAVNQYSNDAQACQDVVAPSIPLN